MAYTVEISKQSVVKLNQNDYQITIHCAVQDDSANVVFEKDYSERYYSALPVSDVKAKLQAQIQADWDKLVAEQQIFTHPQFDSACAEIQSDLDTYVNS